MHFWASVAFINDVLFLFGKYKFSVTSYLRTEKRNAIVGGMKNSKHLIGLAVDVVLDDETQKTEFMEACSRLDITCVDEKDHIHLQQK